MDVSLKPAAPVSFADAFAAVRAFDVAEQTRFLNTLRSALFPNTLTAVTMAANLTEQRFHKGLTCPHCGSEHVRRHGRYRGRQRYRCKACEITFNDVTGTPLAGTHLREKWLDYIERMVKGLPLRKICEELEISLNTAFVWRHKVLNAMKRIDKVAFKGVLEVDETHMLHSRKGEKNITDRNSRKRGGAANKRGISNEQDCILVARDRTGQTHAQLACLGRISLRQAMTVLNGALAEVTVLCSDAHGTWKAFATAEKISHVELNVSKQQRVKNIYHIQNVNGFHSRFKGWLARFNGVASKFLDNYLAWHRFLDAHSHEPVTSRRNGILATACMTPAIETYRTIRNTTFALPS